jgi:hypothetical protein
MITVSSTWWPEWSAPKTAFNAYPDPGNPAPGASCNTTPPRRRLAPPSRCGGAHGPAPARDPSSATPNQVQEKGRLLWMTITPQDPRSPACTGDSALLLWWPREMPATGFLRSDGCGARVEDGKRRRNNLWPGCGGGYSQASPRRVRPRTTIRRVPS